VEGGTNGGDRSKGGRRGRAHRGAVIAARPQLGRPRSSGPATRTVASKRINDRPRLRLQVLRGSLISSGLTTRTATSERITTDLGFGVQDQPVARDGEREGCRLL
jgi:hypothetical protein